MSNTKILIKNEVRIYVTDATEIAQEAIIAQNTLPLGSLVLSTAVAAFSVFPALHTDGRTAIKIDGNGALKTILVETNSEGDVRALVGNPRVKSEYDKEKYNRIPLTLGIGDGGIFSVTREIKGVNFGGQVPLANGDIVTDLAYYFDQSEQVNTAVISDVRLDEKDPKKVERAYSVLFQMLPDHSEMDVRWVEDFVKNTKLSTMTIEQYIEKMDAKYLDQKDIRWKCSCTEEKMQNLVNVLTDKEKKELIEEYGHVEVTCNYCGNRYTFK